MFLVIGMRRDIDGWKLLEKPFHIISDIKSFNSLD